MMENSKCERCGVRPGWVICEKCDDQAAILGFRIRRRLDYDGSTGTPLQLQYRVGKRWSRPISAKTVNIRRARQTAAEYVKAAELEELLTPMAQRRTLKNLALRRLNQLRGRTGNNANKKDALLIKKIRHLLNRWDRSMGFSEVPVSELRPGAILEMLQRRATQPLQLRTVKGEISVLHRIVKWAVTEGLIVQPQHLSWPSDEQLLELRNVEPDGDTSVVRPNDDWEARFRSEAVRALPALAKGQTMALDQDFPELKRANALSVTRGLLACVLTLASGIRSQELAKLRWHELKLEDAVVGPHIHVERIKKNKSQGYVPALNWKDDSLLPLALRLVEVLRTNLSRLRGSLPDDQDLVFDQTDRLNREVGKALSAIGCRSSLDGQHGKKFVTVTITALRHHHISKLIAAGYSPDHVARSCGTSVSMLMLHYTQLGVSEALAASAHLKLASPAPLALLKAENQQ